MTDQTRLLDGCAYTPAAATDIRETFRRMGWIGPEERRLARERLRIAPEFTGTVTMWGRKRDGND